MIDGKDSYIKWLVSTDIDVTISYDGVLIVDGRELCNIYDVSKDINEKILKELDDEYRR